MPIERRDFIKSTTAALTVGAATLALKPHSVLGANDRVLRSFDRGPGLPNLNVAIDSAHRVDSTTIAVRARNDDPNWQETNGVVVDVVAEVVNNKIRTLQSTGTDGTQWIKDGVVVKSGTPAIVLEKCSS